MVRDTRAIWNALGAGWLVVGICACGGAEATPADAADMAAAGGQADQAGGGSPPVTPPPTGGAPPAGGGAGLGGAGGEGNGNPPEGTAGVANAGGGGGVPPNGGAAGSDDQPPPMAKSCAEGDYLLCDEFEGELDPMWTVRGDVTIDSQQVFAGSQALHAHSEGPPAYISTDSIFPVPNNVLYGRVYVYFSALPRAPDWAHWTIVEGAGEGDGSLIRVGGQLNTSENKERWGIGSDGGPTGDWTNHDADPNGLPEEPKEQEWVCVEWLWKGDTNETRFYLDGTEHESLYTSATDHGGSNVDYVMPDFRSIWVGWWLYQGGAMPPVYDVWFDNLALASERIGCGG